MNSSFELLDVFDEYTTKIFNVLRKELDLLRDNLKDKFKLSKFKRIDFLKRHTD